MEGYTYVPYDYGLDEVSNAPVSIDGYVVPSSGLFSVYTIQVLDRLIGESLARYSWVLDQETGEIVGDGLETERDPDQAVTANVDEDGNFVNIVTERGSGVLFSLEGNDGPFDYTAYPQLRFRSGCIVFYYDLGASHVNSGVYMKSPTDGWVKIAEIAGEPQ